MNKSKKIFWILGRKDLIKSGVSLYSLCFIEELKRRGWHVKLSLIPNTRAKEWIYRLTVLPLDILLKTIMGYHIVAKDESYAFLTPFSLKKMIIILHHLRGDDQFLNKNKKDQVADNFLKIFGSQTKKIVTVSEYSLKSLLSRKSELSQNSININNPITGLKPKIIDEHELYEKKLKLFKKFNLPIEANSHYLLYVGCEAPRKNFKTLLLALAKLKNKNIKLLKVGLPFFEVNHIEHLNIIKKSNLEDQVYFVGEVSLEDLNSFYHVANILLLASDFEGFGRTPVEAQLSGCPVISTHGGALKEVLGDSCMVVQEPYNVEEWVEKINLMLNSSKEEIEEWVQKGYKNAKRFEIGHLTDLWEKILLE